MTITCVCWFIVQLWITTCRPILSSFDNYLLIDFCLTLLCVVEYHTQYTKKKINVHFLFAVKFSHSFIKLILVVHISLRVWFFTIIRINSTHCFRGLVQQSTMMGKIKGFQWFSGETFTLLYSVRKKDLPELLCRPENILWQSVMLEGRYARLSWSTFGGTSIYYNVTCLYITARQLPVLRDTHWLGGWHEDGGQT